jgi:hypothetical protein
MMYVYSSFGPRVRFSLAPFDALVRTLEPFRIRLRICQIVQLQRPLQAVHQNFRIRFYALVLGAVYNSAVVAQNPVSCIGPQR